MAFWGVYVKPEEPYILKPDCDGRRLRITQATLGEQCGVEMSRIVLQCAVGNNRSISICSLSMKELHCYPLNLEFEEWEDVVFSVVGSCGVYLAGCYLAQCATCRTNGDGASGFIIKYYDRKTSEEEENLKSKKLSTTEGAENEKGKTFITEEAENEEHKKLSTIEEAENEEHKKMSMAKETENEEDKQLSTTEEAGNKKENDMTSIEVAENGKDKMLSEIEEDIGDTDSFLEGSLCSSEENTYDLTDCFIDDSELAVQPSRQELLGVEVNKMVENAKPKKRVSSSKRLKQDQSTVSNGDIGSNKKRHITKKSSSVVSGGVDYSRGSGGDSISKQKKSIGADSKRGSGGSTLGRGEKDKFNHLANRELESGVDAKNSDLKTHEYHRDDTKSQRKKRKKKEHFSDAIVIDELAKGKPDGKVATRGRKVKIIYTAWIKETGKVIESNSGHAPFKFQLGDDEIIKAWNVGVEGMQVGDKRRITLPPSMGSWRRDESTIPANSCLVYDIELVDVR